ncbi:MAG TPA: hypothetical protein VG052_05180 [Puia sp.]|jgi:hypothetical protein|nr:hypothetical protein [Puia sp.]
MTSTTLADLTRELLSSGVFNHLPDDEIGRLHWIILQGQRGEEMPLQPLLTYWYRGDYYSSNASPRLLQQCNECLQRMGQPLIDVYGEEFYEA